MEQQIQKYHPVKFHALDVVLIYIVKIQKCQDSYPGKYFKKSEIVNDGYEKVNVNGVF